MGAMWTISPCTSSTRSCLVRIPVSTIRWYSSTLQSRRASSTSIAMADFIVGGCRGGDLGGVLLGVVADAGGEELDRHRAERRMAALAGPVGVGQRLDQPRELF